MPTNGHTGMISSDMFFEEESGYQAECTCGWQGTPNVNETQANNELVRHYSEVQQ